MSESKTYMVIGGGGFLGRYIVEALLERKENVRVFDLRQTFEDDRVQFFSGDLRELNELVPAFEGVDTVIHTASPSYQATDAILYSVNVIGTERIIEACKKTGVKELIFTSTASVVFNGKPLLNVDESYPMCGKDHVEPYNRTKEMAETLVLKANCEELKTCALRPSGLFGPRDILFWPKVLDVGKAGKSRFQLGDGKNLMDYTYITNVADSHILAADKISNTEGIAGEAFFITNGEPVPFWDMPVYIWKSFDYPTPVVKLPARIMWYVAILAHLISVILKPIYKFEPTLTTVSVLSSTTHRSFNISKARRVLGYVPKVPLADGRRETVKYFKKQPNWKKADKKAD